MSTVLISFICTAFFCNSGKVFESHLEAGWYPKTKTMLGADLETYFKEARNFFSAQIDPLSVKTLIVPHAGMRFSGLCAASAYQTLLDQKSLSKNKKIKRVIILAPDHSGTSQGIVLPVFDSYKTPLGAIGVDVEVVQMLFRNKLFSKKSTKLFSSEHSLEMQLPFLQKTIESFSIVPLIIGNLTSDNFKQVARVLQEIIDETTLVVVSTDFTHHGKAYNFNFFQKSITDSIKQLDSDVIEALFQKSSLELEKALFPSNKKLTICGRNPLRLFIELSSLGLGRNLEAHLMNYYTSAHKAQKRNYPESLIGSTLDQKAQSSVSYAGIVYTANRKKAVSFTDYEKHALLTLARESIRNYLMGKKGRYEKIYPIKTDNMKSRNGAFITLYEGNKRLRGCIGNIITTQPLYKTISEVSLSSAFHDSRFSPLKKEELKNILIEISILSEPEIIESSKDIKLGTHGIILEKFEKGIKKSAVYLPQVAPSQGWNIEETLSSLSKKAGLLPNAWKDKDTVFRVFTATILSE